ncbi:hypothetical protein NL676_036941 [Syzygium grande]|nr:hypothetical protein NL676_036941 [Syzygium grande]
MKGAGGDPCSARGGGGSGGSGGSDGPAATASDIVYCRLGPAWRRSARRRAAMWRRRLQAMAGEAAGRQRERGGSRRSAVVASGDQLLLGPAGRAAARMAGSRLRAPARSEGGRQEERGEAHGSSRSDQPGVAGLGDQAVGGPSQGFAVTVSNDLCSAASVVSRRRPGSCCHPAPPSPPSAPPPISPRRPVTRPPVARLARPTAAPSPGLTARPDSGRARPACWSDPMWQKPSRPIVSQRHRLDRLERPPLATLSLSPPRPSLPSRFGGRDSGQPSCVVASRRESVMPTVALDHPRPTAVVG